MTTAPSGPITPRNLTARADYAVPGNPAISRPEDAVANTYPGLELNMLNLDSRFFPGLVFDFVARDDHQSPYVQPEIYGAALDFIDLTDPALRPDRVDNELASLASALLADLQGDPGTAIGDGGAWYLAWVEQHDRRIEMIRTDDGSDEPMDGLWVWRLVRSLDPFRRNPDDAGAPVRIGLHERTTNKTVELTGWRRRYTEPDTGVISLAYEPGELGQTLCSPWQHDFRDCACHYWAANHPDVVYAEIVPGTATLPDGQAADARTASTLIDWLREDRRPEMAAAAHPSIDANRPTQIDHYQINQRWQDLNIVIDTKEIGDEYVPATLPYPATPFADSDELVATLRDRLAPLEMTLALEYLYARFSIVEPADSPPHPTLSDDATFGRHFILLTAVSEMQHLRWANQLLWELHQHGVAPDYRPVLTPSTWVPVRGGGPSPDGAPESPGRGWTWRAAQVRSLSEQVLDDFIAIEHPDAFLDASYGRVVATLRRPEYPPGLAQLASRVLEDGNEHFTRFRDLRSVLIATYGPDFTGYVRDLSPQSTGAAAGAIEQYEAIRSSLTEGFTDQAAGNYRESGPEIRAARASMDELLATGEQLAADGIGIDFFGAAS